MPVPLDDPGVVAGPEHVGAGPLREVDERVEPERAVAAHARVRGQALRVAVDERPHDGVAELLAQVEGDVRQPERVARLPGADDHGVGRAAGALGARAGGIEPEPQRDADRVSAPRARSATALSTPPLIATATRPGLGAAANDRRDRVRERVRGERLARNRCGLEQRQPDERPRHPGRIRLDDALAVDDQPRRGVLARRGRSRRSARRACVPG